MNFWKHFEKFKQKNKSNAGKLKNLQEKTPDNTYNRKQ